MTEQSDAVRSRGAGQGLGDRHLPVRCPVGGVPLVPLVAHERGSAEELVDATGRVVQFISYEGTFTAGDGAADDMDSTDIGVSEPEDSPVGHSLQLTGQGRKASDFQWQSPRPSSRGSVNADQLFLPPG